MYFQAKAYFNFLLKSQNQHGLHSPFVYDLVTKCFYDKTDHKAYDLIKNYRNDLLGNKKEIKVKDFGAGSRVFKSDQRPIFSIARNAGITLHRAKLLYRLTKYLKIENSLELGTSLGIASAAIAASKKTRLRTIEGCPETAKIAKHQFHKYELENINLKSGRFDPEIDQISKNDEKFDLIYFDGNHQKQPTLEYFQKLLPSAHNNSVFIFDDIHWSKGMEKAWEEIKSHPDVKVSIDTFQWGLIFFRKEQVKQHFRIRV
ncbi:O-methyltransferase [Christiangramia sp. SM2212]|uniref:Class I SAM-dependent methyltransferase n=1 Tax=Christiangramia sediminicola TaxID=3073267 RepID=A0ABU1EMR2_9FLAO|nr:class I SAM-dependent methyltransferase [Christiangramia sp. SM2212]MDR5589676.1 class I SAM-dependent methyltransferase [Christiangramia sp. SM2212]